MKRFILNFLCLATLVYAKDTNDFYKLIEQLEKKGNQKTIQKEATIVDPSIYIKIDTFYTIKGMYQLNNKKYVLIESKNNSHKTVKTYTISDRIDDFRVVVIDVKKKTVTLKNQKNNMLYRLTF